MLINGTAGGDIIFGTSSADTINGLGGADTLYGLDGDDILDGGDGNDTLDGGVGADMMIGGSGTNIYRVDNIGDIVIAPAGVGIDNVYATADFTIGDDTEIEGLYAVQGFGQQPVNLTGNSANNRIEGNALANVLRGGGGDDILIGFGGGDVFDGGPGADIMSAQGGGSNTFYVDNLGDRINPGTGDLVYITAVIDYTVANASRIYAAPGTLAINITGSSGNNDLRGNDGANVLRGGGGLDTLAGGAGDDTYIIDGLTNVVIEAEGAGFDSLVALVSYVLGAGVSIELMTLGLVSGTGAINLTGNERNDWIWGNAGANQLTGLVGDDALYGYGGNDVLNGGTGIDLLVGGLGDDTYFGDSSDVILEFAGEGRDRLVVAESFTLRSGIDIEILELDSATNTLAANLLGNEIANELRGNAGANILDGAGGADSMIGGAGDDTYFIDNAGDIATEAANGGYDSLVATISYTLAAGSSIELMTTGVIAGTAPIDLTGNELANQIWGNDGVNRLSGAAGDDALIGFGGDDRLEGGSGADLLVGGTGNDTYVVGDTGDLIIESAGEGQDTVLTSVSLTLAAGLSIETLASLDPNSKAALDLTGNAFANAITGDNGANIIDGGAGSDTLTGRAGADIFMFSTAFGPGNVDTITDFLGGFDKIFIDRSLAPGLGVGGLPVGAFVVGAGAADADDRIIYNSATGALLFDADGSGGIAAVQFATLGIGLSINSTDFVIF